jgi:hypothetical protein
MAQIIAGGTKPDSGGNVEVITQTQTTTWTQLQGKPYIAVSSKGIVNGLSTIPNDGADFGPDTTKGATTPGQNGSPYTETVGIQEAYNYIVTGNGGKIQLATGIFTLDEPVVFDTPVNVRIEGTIESNPTNNANPTDYLAGTIIVPSESFPTTSTITPTGVAYLFEILPNPNSQNYGAFEIEHISFLGNTLSNYGTIGSIGAIMAGWNTNFIPRLIFRGMKFHNCLYTADICDFGGPAYFDNIHITDCGHGFRLETLDTYIGLYEAYNNTISGIELGTPLPNVTPPSQTLNFNISHLDMAVAGTAAGIMVNQATHGATSQEQANSWTVEVSIAEMVFAGTNGSTLLNPLGYSVPIYMHFGSLFTQFMDNFIVNNAMTQTYGNYGSLNVFVDSFFTVLSQDVNWYTNQNTVNGTLTPTPVLLEIRSALVMLNGYTISNLVSQDDVIIDAPDFAKTMPPTTPSVPTSATAQENTNPYAVDVYAYGGDVTEIQITRNGTAYTVLSVSTAIAMSGQAYKLNPGDSITVTYTTAPTWEWLSD